MIAAALAVLVSGLAVFQAPGAVVLAAARRPLKPAQAPAFAFAVSLALLTAAFAVCLLFGASIAAAPMALVSVTLLAVLAASRLAPVSPEGSADAAADPPPATMRIALIVLAIACAGAALAFAPVGSIDRWWYLAYVRSFVSTPVLTLAEPFLGSGQVFARFGVHPWLFGLALWSHLSGVDPVAVYERASPLLVVAAAISAAAALANALFGVSAKARLGVMATMLLWSGGMVPLLARAGEDKILATAVLFPLVAATFLRSIGDSGTSPARGGALALLFAVSVACAAVHALAYAFALVALLPFAALVALTKPSQRRAAAAATAVLLAVAVAPAASGFLVRDRLRDIGADLASPDHPVVRVHEARQRLLDLPPVGYVVHPRILLHPLALLAAAGLPLLVRRRPGDAAMTFLVTTSAVPLAIAFLPPLPAAAGALIPPWMVYRVLWLLPLGPLAAIAAEKAAGLVTGADADGKAAAAWLPRREVLAAALLVALGLPAVVAGGRDRFDENRGRLASPSGPEFRELLAALGALPPDAIVAAAPELAERLPAFSATAMAASLDRSTIVFSASREKGESRLRARAAALAGDDDAALLAEKAGLRLTHAVYDPRARHLPDCDTVLMRSSRYALCLLRRNGKAAVAEGSLEVATEAPSAVLLRAECHAKPPGFEPGASASAPRAGRRDPWSAAAPLADCRVALPPALAGRDDLWLNVVTAGGQATDEIRVTVSANGEKAGRGTARTKAGAAFALKLPRLEAGELDVRIASSFLPAVQPVDVSIVAR